MENKTGVTWQEPLGPGAAVLRGFALSGETDLLAALQGVVAQAPLRHMVTPGGYRYDPVDPVRGVKWPPMPEAFSALATRAAAQAGFQGFQPDACLVNRYEPGARLSLH